MPKGNHVHPHCTDKHVSVPDMYNTVFEALMEPGDAPNLQAEKLGSGKQRAEPTVGFLELGIFWCEEFEVS